MLATDDITMVDQRFLRYIDTRPNGDALRKCILTGPYTPTMVTTPAVPAKEDSPEVPAKTSVETVLNMTPENKAHYESEKEAIHLILTGIGDEISFNLLKHVKTAQEMWKPSRGYNQASEEDSDPKPAQKDKICRKLLSLQSTSRNSTNLQQQPQTFLKHQNKNVDTNPRYKTDNQTGQFGNQRAVNVVGARETVGGPVVQQSGIQCFNCKEFAEKGVQLQAEQSDWLADTDEEIDEQELEAHYSYMAKIQEVPNADSGTDAEPLEQDDQNDVECDNERAAPANLIANLKLDVDDNKKEYKSN
ncbi:hypothetical protein Tco_0005804 [Tanacetum coccineum]